MPIRYNAPDIINDPAWMLFHDEVKRIKSDKGMLILAHNYQSADILEVADITGDSLELAIRAQQATEEIIVVCGVRFMAETAKLLNPDKKVLIPRDDAGCPLADQLTPEMIREAKARYPGAPFVIYVNSTAACKAESDITCTSSNAEEIVRSLPDDLVLFGPDSNLAAFVQRQIPEKKIISVPDGGNCPIHNAITRTAIEEAQMIGGYIVCHPECTPEVSIAADAVVSTGKMKAVIADQKICHVFTETSMLYLLQKAWPDKILYGVDGAVCKDMQKTRAESLLDCITQEISEITIDELHAPRARSAIEKMLALQ
ncbi:MAG: quinolinate synthase NadA [Methanomicrobiales archaeon]|jgi:quinolinate synthase|nr:quinolinate synthase NadA [Methanomicrobiales archaeon]